ncbi:H-2 class II histocompatibility antigen, A-Q alpha chain isoform X6 [Esox lucius]|uniref:H-2 class II histocompatibility antigen, A-Q alpha chain isoform X6 n=1 Tax=Esox lucius TaxID=8010 RepID=UPI00147682FD|nr:H-2 class II histocompatibility antigen, A-Q alpha chain isoform X6 [Esox lucius]
MCTVFVILHLGVISALVQAQHVFNVMIKRSKTEEFKMTACADGEEYLYVDLDNRKVVITAPEFGEEIECPICSLAAENGRIYTKELSNIFGLDTPEDKVPPDVMLYPKEEVKQGVNNSLVCFVNNFFPPPVQVKWTKNDVNITKEVKLSPYFFNTDITFYHFSTLTFDPEDGDLYTCTVEHPALDEPLTRKWEFLTDHFLPWYKKKNRAFRSKTIFMHDNAPSHAAENTSVSLAAMGIKGGTLMVWPPSSPDLNPFENLWSILKQTI